MSHTCFFLALPDRAPPAELQNESISVQSAECNLTAPWRSVGRLWRITIISMSIQLTMPTSTEARATHKTSLNFSNCYLSEFKQRHSRTLCAHPGNYWRLNPGPVAVRASTVTTRLQRCTLLVHHKKIYKKSKWSFFPEHGEGFTTKLQKPLDLSCSAEDWKSFCRRSGGAVGLAIVRRIVADRDLLADCKT